MIPNDLDNAFSLGTGPVMNTLLHILNEYRDPPDTVVINVDTLIRNCSSIEGVNESRKFEKENGLDYTRSVRRLVGYAQHEIQVVLTDLIQMFNETKITNPTIILYLGNYKPFVPPVQQRGVSESKQAAVLATKQIETSVKARLMQKSGKVTVIQLPKVETKLPYKLIIDELHSLKNNHIVAMMSHHPLDYHLHKHCSNFYLLNSYTGKVSTVADLAKKVFDTDVLPFNPIIHSLLGDKEDIQPFLKGQEKKRLLEIATTESWSTHTEEYISDRFKDLSIRVPFKI